jgi:hypothetical protein
VNRTVFLSCLLLVAFTRVGFSQDASTTKVSEADYATFVKLRSAVELADAKSRAKDPEKLEAVKEDLRKAFADSGWSQERFADVSEALLGAANSIFLLDSEDAEEAGYAQEQLDQMDPVTVATARAHVADLNDSSAVSDAAVRQARADAQRELRGPAPAPAQLTGRWDFNLEATVQLNASGLGPDTKKRMRDSMAKTMSFTSYIFGPGGAVEVLTRTAEGPLRSEKTTFRISEDRIFFKTGKGEVDLDIGMKDGQLRMGTMGIYSIFDKAK